MISYLTNYQQRGISMPVPLSVLIVEDNESDAQFLVRLLKKAGHEITFERVETAEQMRSALEERNWDIVISDYKLPRFDGYAALKILQNTGRDIPFIVISGAISEDMAVKMMMAGAQDYLDKNDMARLIPAVKRELKQSAIRLERKNAEEALQKSEERFRSLFEDSPIAIWEEDFSLVKTQIDRLRQAGITDFRAYWKEHPEDFRTLADLIKILQVNQACVKVFRAENKEQVIKNVSHYFTEESLKIFEDEMVALAEGQTQFKGEIPVRNWLGERVVFDLTLCVQRGCENNLARVLVSALDITERKRAEETLRISEERYRGLFDSMIDGFALHEIICDENGKPADCRFLEVNPAFERLTGLKSEDLIGRTMLEALPDTESYWIDIYGNVALTGRSAFFENYSKELSRHFEVSAYCPHPGQFATILVDITERKRAEDALQKSEEQYRRLVDLLPSGVIVHSKGKILMANEASAKFFSAENPQQLVGTPLIERVHPDYREIVRARVTNSLDINANAPLIEEKLLRLDNTSFDAEVAAQPITYTGEPSILAIFNDITKRKKSEEELRNRLTELEAVHTVSKALRTARATEDALPLLLDQTLTALTADTGAIWLHDPVKDELRMAVMRGWFNQVNEAPLKPGQGIAGEVFVSGKTRTAKDFATDPSACFAEGAKIPAGWGGACVPISSDEKIIGVLFVSVQAPREITPEQVQLLASLTEMTGAALYRMRLHEETVQRLKNVQALHEIDQAITASLDLSIILGILLNHVIAQLGVDAAAVLLFHPYQNFLEYAAKHGFRTKPNQINIAISGSLPGSVILSRNSVKLFDLKQSPEKDQIAAIWAGEGFNAYIGVPLIVKGEVKGVLEIFNRQALTPNLEWVNFLTILAGQAAIAIADSQLFNNLQRANQELIIAYDTTIEGWSHALDLRDKETEGHTLRVTEMALTLASKMGMRESDLLHFRRGALLHDIGKMGVPDNILLKSGKLTAKEKIIIQQHAQHAYDMLSPIKYLRPALDIPYCHHEKWDGTGYPRGLKEEQIPLAARIFAIIDVWDALTSNRPYRKAWTKEKARKYIQEQNGKHFDPHVVEKFMEILERN
jgi:PAS domain S-box-containing protein/putative nucleotidyltransferase with HDIG domain